MTLATPPAYNAPRSSDGCGKIAFLVSVGGVMVAGACGYYLYSSMFRGSWDEHSIRGESTEVVVDSGAGASRLVAASEVPPVAPASATSGARGGTQWNPGSVISSMQAGFRRCYNRGLGSDPQMAGSIRVTVQLKPDGSVLRTSATHEGNLSAGVVECVQARIRTAQFAPLEPGTSSTLVIPVTLQH